IVYLQMRFVNEKKLGFQKDQIIVYEFRGGIKQDNVDIIGNQFSQNPMTSHFTFSSSLPINVNSSTFLNDDKTGGNIYRLYVDANFLDTYEIELLEGRFLNERDTEEDLNYVLNETAAQALGWTAKTAIGKILVNDGGERKNIVGVVKDFHMHSLHLPIAPLMMGIADYKAYISVKVRPENIRETISYMEQVLQPFTSYPFEFQFLDDHFNQLYEADQKQAQMFSVFTFLAVLVASLGLFGLAALTVSQRTKEIGIRKVLGATIKDTMVIFSTRFLLLVAIAFLAAIPVSWYLANSWLDKFSYRIVIEWWMFLVAGACAIILAFSTISSQSLKASLINPVESLKDE
ncbi:MAG: FtsX-like permease family protein, partial [Bacteroidota bacterium]